MVKVSVMYPNTAGARFDHTYYRDKHMPLLKARMGDSCLYYTVDKGLAGGEPVLLGTRARVNQFAALSRQRLGAGGILAVNVRIGQDGLDAGDLAAQRLDLGLGLGNVALERG